jgi:hypothetical protein
MSVDHRKNHIKVLGQLKIVESPRLGFGGVIAWAGRCFWPLNLDFVKRKQRVEVVAESSRQPLTSLTGSSWPGWGAPHSAVVTP